MKNFLTKAWFVVVVLAHLIPVAVCMVIWHFKNASRYRRFEARLARERKETK